MAFNFSPKIITNGLILYLDAANSKSYDNSSDNWIDLVRKTETTVDSNINFSNDGNGSFEMSGTTHEILSPALSELSNTSFTLCGWVKGNFSLFNSFGTWIGYDGLRRILIRNDGKLLSQLSGNFLSNGNISSNSWHYITYMYDKENLKEYYYINGEYDSEQVASGSEEWSSSFYFGQYDLSSNYKLFGNVSLAQIYNKALTSKEIKDNYDTLKNRFKI